MLMKSWEIIADNLREAGWSWGCVLALDLAGRTIWIADAHRDDGKRFVESCARILVWVCVVAGYCNCGRFLDKGSVWEKPFCFAFNE
jgi:hypothetical protein